MRAVAEMENVRRRAAEDVSKAQKFSIEKFVKNLLPVMDSLEKAIEMTAEIAPTTMEITAIIVARATMAEILITAVPIIITDRMVLIINMIPIRMALLAV